MMELAGRFHRPGQDQTIKGMAIRRRVSRLIEPAGAI